MKTIAYLANQFPNSIETYVADEIIALRKQGFVVIPSSVFGPGVPTSGDRDPLAAETIYFSRLRPIAIFRAACLAVAGLGTMREFCQLALTDENEPLARRLKAVLHTLLGAYYAALLVQRQVDHIHVHHGYFAAWIAMVAARLLGIEFSITLHGSDLLVDHPFLDVKLRNCELCFTVSDFNRRFILRNYPAMEPSKVLLRRLGVAPALPSKAAAVIARPRALFVILAVGRLQAVKNHSFLIDACAILKSHNLPLLCLIAGDGPERRNLERRIETWGLQREVKLLGHVAREDLEAVYPMVNAVVLTSTSEGIPVSLMEAMAHGRIVVAPAITGVPELVVDGATGFLYAPNSMDDFVARVESVYRASEALESVENAAREHVHKFFDRERNLRSFTRVFLQRSRGSRDVDHENPVLQQV